MGGALAFKLIPFRDLSVPLAPRTDGAVSGGRVAGDEVAQNCAVTRGAGGRATHVVFTHGLLPLWTNSDFELLVNSTGISLSH